MVVPMLYDLCVLQCPTPLKQLVEIALGGFERQVAKVRRGDVTSTRWASAQSDGCAHCAAASPLSFCATFPKIPAPPAKNVFLAFCGTVVLEPFVISSASPQPASGVGVSG